MLCEPSESFQISELGNPGRVQFLTHGFDHGNSIGHGMLMDMMQSHERYFNRAWSFCAHSHCCEDVLGVTQ
jgi:hypothetical protein